MNEVLADIASIADGEQVLDAGCGYGGSAIWLAKHRGCQVTGITLVAEQVSAATRFAEAHGVADKVSFLEMDYNAPALPHASFDVIWALESLIHSDRKEDFFPRVLPPAASLRLPTWPTATIAVAVGKIACRVGLYNPIRLRGLDGGAAQTRALRAGLWTYTVLRAQKLQTAPSLKIRRYGRKSTRLKIEPCRARSRR